MDVGTFIQSLWGGVLEAGLIAMVAVGLYLVLGVARVLNFAHGHLLVLGGFCTWGFRETYNLNFWLAGFLGVLIMGMAGIVMERFPFRRFYGNFVPIICVGIALIYLFEGGVVQFFGPETKTVGTVISGTSGIKGWFIMRNWDWLVIGAGLGCLLGAGIFLARTRIGRAMRATAVDPDTANLQGIGALGMAKYAMFIGTALAAVGGGLMAPKYGASIGVGLAWMIKGTLAIIIGGLGSFYGCLFACLLLGMAVSFSITYINAQAGYIAMFILLVVVILVRPWGLFGKKITIGMPGE